MRETGSRQQDLSDLLRLLPDQAPSPSRPEQVAPLRIFFVEIGRIDDTVGSKTAKIAAQLAPCRQYPHGFVIADGDRPDVALAVAAMFVAIAQADFPAFVNLRARPRHVDAVRLFAPVRAGATGGLKHKGPQPFRDDVG